MIKNTFVFLPKIGLKKEKNLWRQGILEWDCFITRENIKGISNRSKREYNLILKEAKKALFENNSNYFLGKLPNTEMWRIYEYFKEDAVFLDIEASSSTSKDSYLTVISLFDGINAKSMLRFNFDKNILKKELEKYKVVITFNGSSFDLPYLDKKYPGLLPKIPHIDVRHLCSKIGLTGSLKEIEIKLGIKRENEIVKKIYNGDPLKLWKTFKATGDTYYIDLLVEYSQEDVINLKKITEYCIKRLNEIYENFLKT